MSGPPPDPPLDAQSPGVGEQNASGFGAFRQLTFHSVLGGLCPLVPVPFLDDWLLGRVKRWMVADLDRALDTGLDPEARIVLAGGRDAWRAPGCAGGCLWVLEKVVVKMLVKLFRTVLYFLAVRDGLHAATEVFHEGYLAAHGLRRTPLPGDPALQREHAGRLRTATLETVEGMDLQPVRDVIRRTFRGSRGLLIRGSRMLARPFLRRKARRTAETGEARAAARTREKEEELLGGLVDRLAASLWGNREYFARLEAEFERRLETLRAPHP